MASFDLDDISEVKFLIAEKDAELAALSTKPKAFRYGSLSWLRANAYSILLHITLIFFYTITYIVTARLSKPAPTTALHRTLVFTASRRRLPEI